jgi:hypothetical protein
MYVHASLRRLVDADGGWQGFTPACDWFNELDLPGAFQVGLMRRICLSLPSFFSRMPNSSFILSDTMEPKDGSRAGDKLISGMIGEGWSMVHLPYGGGVDVDIGAALSGSTEYRAWWIDPRTGGREIFEEGKVRSGAKHFHAPPEGAQEDDWLLYIEALSGSSAWFRRAM